MPDHYLLQWSNHLTNIASAFTSLRQNNKLVDVTLAADGRSLEAHKVVLCACSAYFEELLSANPCKHPIVYLKDVQHEHLAAVVEFMYNGAVYVGNEQLDDVLKLGASLRVRGMLDVKTESRQGSGEESRDLETPAAKRRKKRTGPSRDGSADDPGVVPAAGEVVQEVPPPPALTGPPLHTMLAAQVVHAEAAASPASAPAAAAAAEPPQGKPATVPTAAERKAAPPRSYSEGDMATKGKEMMEAEGDGAVSRQKRCQLQRQPRIKRECEQPSGSSSAEEPPQHAQLQPLHVAQHQQHQQHQQQHQQHQQQQYPQPPPLQQRAGSRSPSPQPQAASSVETLVLDAPPCSASGSYLAVPAPGQYWPPARQMSTPTPVLSTREGTLVKQGSMPAMASPSQSAPAPVQKQRSTPVLSRGASGPAFFMVSSSNVPMMMSQAASPAVPHILLTSADELSGPATPASASVASERAIACRSHAPVLRDGPAVSCSHCWNTEYSQGRTLRRKTKYMCRDCSVSLCIVPCFQEYHETVKAPLVVTRDPNKPVTKKILPKLGSL